MRGLRLIGRALLLRCPNCGRASMFHAFFRMRDFCSECGFLLNREPGYYSGAMGLNLVAAELIFVIIFVLWLVVTWPDPPWTFLQWGGMAGMVVLPILGWPFSRSIWLAIDLFFHPPEAQEVLPGFSASADRQTQRDLAQ